MAIEFIYQDKKSKEVFYINTELSFNFETRRNYFSGIGLYSSCTYSTCLKEYEDVITILSKDDYNLLKKYDSATTTLGCNIKEGSLRYNIGIEAMEMAKNIIKKLSSEENTKLYEDIIKKEKEYVSEEYNIDIGEVEDIFNNYPAPFKDRYIISNIYNSPEELAEEELREYSIMDNDNAYIFNRYFDFETFGEDLINEQEDTFLLSDDRVIRYTL